MSKKVWRERKKYYLCTRFQERNFEFNLKTTDKFIEKTEGSTTSTENEKKRALILFFIRKNEAAGVEPRDSVNTKKSLILAQDER